MPFVAALLLLLPLAQAAPLPALKIEGDSVTVSGISSGAFMAVQLQVALSSRIRGVGSVAGGIYQCAEGKALRALGCMGKADTIEAEKFVLLAREASEAKTIDPVSHLTKARVYIFQSEGDKTVRPPAGAKLREFFSAFVPEGQIMEAGDTKAGHGFLTRDYGVPCEKGEPPFLLQCGRDQAGEILSHLYPRLAPPAETPGGELLAFDQSLYAEPEANVLKDGYLYIPAACRKDSCRLHIALHGCKMSSDFIQDQFRVHAGYNRWADTNRLVVLYPNAGKSPGNPNGCWDWFGAYGADYALKSGKQVAFFGKLIDELTKGAPSARGEKSARRR